jgi:TolB-like protein
VHNAGLLHRDIKVQNVMRAEDGRIVLMDFGAGREFRDDAASDLTGTPLYLAPEVLRGQPAAVRSDLYSLGVLLYHLLTGSYPVHARTVCEVRRAHESNERTAVMTARRDVPPKVARVIERAIDPRPERRYESADALGADLATLKPRAKIVRLAYAAGIAATCILVGGVGWEVAGRQVGSSRTPGALLAGFAGLNSVGAVNDSPAKRPIIAVLPLKNLSAEPDSEYFVDGLTDEIIRNLAVIEGLEVRSRTSSFAFKDKPRNLRNIGDQLGANLVVEGSVLRAGNSLRINVQLVQVAGDMALWADRFDRELKDIFAIQDEISRAIVNKLRLTLGRGQRRYNTNLEAYELYLKARALVDRRGVVNAQKAADLFGQVIAKDSAFAPAHAGLANAYAFMSFPSYEAIPFETAYSIMRPAAVKALQLDPLLAEAFAAMGWVYSYERDWPNAEKAFQQAIGLNPSLTPTYTSYSISTLQPLERFGEALQLLQTASRNDPLSLDVQREIGAVQMFAGRYEESIDTLQRVRAVESDFPFVGTFLARAMTFAGRPAEAFPFVNKNHWSIAHAYVMTGRRVEAEKMAASNKGNPFAEAMIYAAMGDVDRTFEALERTAVSQPQRVGSLLIAPEMAVLRGDPRLAAFRKKVGLL